MNYELLLALITLLSLIYGVVMDSLVSQAVVIICGSLLTIIVVSHPLIGKDFLRISDK